MFSKYLFAAIVACLYAGVADVGAQTNSPARLKALSHLPDWSGIWQADNSFRTFDAGSQAAPPAPGAAHDNVADVFGGAPRDHAPYNSVWAAKYQKMLAGDNKTRPDSNTRYCAAGFPRLMASPFQFEITVQPQETMLIFTQREVRHIYTDGRAHPPADDLWPMLWGDSIGHWEGLTLVIDTVSLKDDVWLDPSGATLSEQAHIRERLHQIGPERLQDDITIEDPVALTAPWKVTRTYKKIHDFDRMIDEVCNENDRNPIVNGKVQSILTIPEGSSSGAAGNGAPGNGGAPK
jgi:hypothetical protein